MMLALPQPCDIKPQPDPRRNFRPERCAPDPEPLAARPSGVLGAPEPIRARRWPDRRTTGTATRTAC